MADCVRAIKNAAPDLPIHVHLVEASPVLSTAQKEKLAKSDVDISWHTSLDALPATPAIFIANEFFDALPIDQLILKDDMLYHYCVGLGAEDELIFGVGHPVSSGLDIDLGTIKMVAKAGEGTILEVSPHRLFAMEEVAKHIASNEGAGIIIDYGFAQSGFGDTFQAIEKHQYVHPLKNPGHADLTSHVDFPSLTQPIEPSGAELCGILTQGHFLELLGIHERAKMLQSQAKDDTTKSDIDLACKRLTDQDQMGELFKVMILQAKGKIPPAPFSSE
jgi:NADH dehydrogenase [ubiquinone] 1 alpha subcomplex assembly factor 7